MATGSGKDMKNKFRQEIMSSIKKSIQDGLHDVAKDMVSEALKAQGVTEDALENFGKNTGKKIRETGNIIKAESEQVAKVLKPQGIKGEIKVELFTSDVDFIKKEEEHRLINNSDEPLEVLESAYGDIISEEDIIRHQDIYGR